MPTDANRRLQSSDTFTYVRAVNQQQLSAW